MNPLTLSHQWCILKKSDAQLKEFFTHELSPFPTSLFTEEGMRKGVKSSFYAALTTVTEKIRGKTFVVVNGGHLLHKVVWAHSATFGNIADRYIQYLTKQYGSNVAQFFMAIQPMLGRRAQRPLKGSIELEWLHAQRSSLMSQL